jgi:shikimate dehydrogenase
VDIGDTGGTGAVRLSGYNTDVAGVEYAIRRVLPAGGPPRHPLVIGAGGTARAALAALAATGADRAGVVARRPAAARPLIEIGTVVGVDVRVLPWDTLATGVPPDVDLVVATTPAGATDALARRPWPADTALVELLYHPWPTLLAARAHACGARLAGGLAVLAAQAVDQVELFTAGVRVDVGVLLSAGQAALSARSSTAGQANQLCRPNQFGHSGKSDVPGPPSSPSSPSSPSHPGQFDSSGEPRLGGLGDLGDQAPPDLTTTTTTTTAAIPPIPSADASRGPARPGWGDEG